MRMLPMYNPEIGKLGKASLFCAQQHTMHTMFTTHTMHTMHTVPRLNFGWMMLELLSKLESEKCPKMQQAI